MRTFAAVVYRRVLPPQSANRLASSPYRKLLSNLYRSVCTLRHPLSRIEDRERFCAQPERRLGTTSSPIGRREEVWILIGTSIFGAYISEKRSRGRARRSRANMFLRLSVVPGLCVCAHYTSRRTGATVADSHRIWIFTVAKECWSLCD